MDLKNEKVLTDEELMNLIQEYLEKDFDELWFDLTSKERKKVFSKLLTEYMVSLIKRKAKEYNKQG